MTQRLSQTMLVLMMLLVGMIFSTGTAQACSCALGSPVAQMERADAVFTGVIVERSGSRVDKVGKNVYTDGQFTYTIEVDRVFKGEVTKVQEVVAGTGEASCGVVFPQDGPILVFGTSTGGVGVGKVAPDQYGTNLCSGSRTGSMAPVSLGEGEPPIGSVEQASTPTDPDYDMGQSAVPNWVLVGGVALLGAAGLGIGLLVARRRN